MAFDGSGTFTRTDGTRNGATVWAQADAASVAIESDDHDTHDEDIADGLSNCICKDGQTTVTANLPMNSKKFTGLAAGSSNGDSVRYEQISGLITPLTWVPTYTPNTGAFGTVTLNAAVYYLMGPILEFFLDFKGTFSVQADYLRVTIPVEIAEFGVVVTGQVTPTVGLETAPLLFGTRGSSLAIDFYQYNTSTVWGAQEYSLNAHCRCRRL